MPAISHLFESKLFCFPSSYDKLKENEGKVFTKKRGNDIIKKDYNPSEVNLIYKRRDGLCMKETEIGEINENLN